VVIQGRSNRGRIAVYGVLLFLTGPVIVGVNFGYAQEITPKLAVVETTVMQSIADHSTLIPIKSDGEGNIYVRFYQPDVVKPLWLKSSGTVQKRLPTSWMRFRTMLLRRRMSGKTPLWRIFRSRPPAIFMN
jgi:hypothetical protein